MTPDLHLVAARPDITAELEAFERAIRAGDPHTELAVRLVDLKRALAPAAARDDDLLAVRNALSRQHWAIFKYLHAHLGEIVSHDDLSYAVWGRHTPADTTNSLRAAIFRLRERLQPFHWVVHSHHAQGWRLERISRDD